MIIVSTYYLFVISQIRIRDYNLYNDKEHLINYWVTKKIIPSEKYFFIFSLKPYYYNNKIATIESAFSNEENFKIISKIRKYSLLK